MNLRNRDYYNTFKLSLQLLFFVMYLKGECKKKREDKKEKE